MNIHESKDGDIVIVHKRISLKNSKLPTDFKQFARIIKRRFPKNFIIIIKNGTVIDCTKIKESATLLSSTTGDYYKYGEIITFRKATQREEFLYHLYGPHILKKK